MRDQNGYTALHSAAAGGHTEIVALLIQRPTDIKDETKEGCPLICCASRNGQEETVLFLLTCHKDYPYPDTLSLLRAYHFTNAEENKRHKDTFSLAEERKRSLEEGTRDGWLDKQLLDFINNHLRKERMPCLESLAKVNEAVECPMGGKARLPGAVIAGNLFLARALIVAGADVNAQDSDHNTPLHWAASQQDRGAFVAVMLRQKTLRLNGCNSSGMTPLHCALKHGSGSWVESMLFNAGAGVLPREILPFINYLLRQERLPLLERLTEVNQVVVDYGPDHRRTKGTRLHAAVFKRNLSLVRLLLAAGADVHAKDLLRGETALHVAVGRFFKEIFELLLENGSSVDARDNLGLSALHRASSGDVVDAIIDWVSAGHLDYKVDSLSVLEKKRNLVRGLHARQIGEARYVISAAMAVHDKDNKGRTPLHYAVGKGAPDVMVKLLEKGADLNARDKDGKTPLHYVVKIAFIPYIKMLLEKGADPNARDNNGKTPLHYAVQKGRISALVILLRNRADFRVQDNNGKAPFYYASTETMEAILRMRDDRARRQNAAQ